MAELIMNVNLVNNDIKEQHLKKKEEKKNDVSFKDTLNKVKEDIKNLKEEKKEKAPAEIVKDIEKKVQNIEEKLSSVEIDDSSKEELLKFLNEIKEFLLKMKNIDKDKENNFEKIFNTIQNLLQLIEKAINEGDFNGLKDIIKNNLISFKDELNAINVSFKNLLAEEKNISQVKVKSEVEPKNIEVKEFFEKIEVKPQKEITNLEKKESELKPIIMEKGKKEIDNIKELIISFDKKVEKQESNLIVKSYTPFTNSLNKANIESIINQITARSLIVVRNGKSELNMQLFPPELGRVNIKFLLEDGNLTGKIVVSTKEAFMLFDHNKEQLAQSLNQAGVDVGKIDLSLGNFETKGDSNSSGDEKMEKSFFFGGIENDFLEESLDENLNILIDSTINYLV